MSTSDDKIARLVALKGTPKAEHEGHAASHNTASGASVQINAQHVTLSNVTIGAGGTLEELLTPKAPRVVNPANMTQEERQAFEVGRWDGLERRSRDLIKEEKAFRRDFKRRQQDRQNMIAYFTMMFVLSLCITWLILSPFIYHRYFEGIL
jgi:hypothetical protein